MRIRACQQVWLVRRPESTSWGQGFGLRRRLRATQGKHRGQHHVASTSHFARTAWLNNAVSGLRLDGEWAHLGSNQAGAKAIRRAHTARQLRASERQSQAVSSGARRSVSRWFGRALNSAKPAQPCGFRLECWRRGWDSNPGDALGAQRFSRPPRSTAPAPRRARIEAQPRRPGGTAAASPFGQWRAFSAPRRIRAWTGAGKRWSSAAPCTCSRARAARA